MSVSRTTVLVIGGGPAGSTIAAMLGRSGLDVTLLERAVFPRYHIGESLLASCLSILRLSGAFDKVEAAGFRRKRGSLIHWADDEWILDWAKLVDPDAWSWQVDRAAYDEILLRNAAEQGVKVIEGATVKKIEFDGARPVRATWTATDGTPQTITCDFLADASGRNSVLAKQHLNIRRPHQSFQNIAVWGYWTGARLLPGSPEGAINVLSTPQGWFWHIPLADKYSVGYVTHRDVFAEQRPQYASLEEHYLSLVNGDERLRGVLVDAIFTAPVRAEQDYSYVADRFSGPGHVMVGDAACFLDPLLSTGVHLAQYSAMVGAAAIGSALRGEMVEDKALAFFEYTYRRAYSRMLVLVSRMYEAYNGRDEYFWQSQKLVHSDTRQPVPVRSFTDIITGLADVRESAKADLRVGTDALVNEAEFEQDGPTGGNRYMGGIDMSSIWDLWRDPMTQDDVMDGIVMVDSPVLGLQQR
jgi:flavin-dependent dehydrogenase